MTSFIIECYLARNPAAVADALARAQRAAELADAISYLRTTYIPGDEICLHLFEAQSSHSPNARASAGTIAERAQSGVAVLKEVEPDLQPFGCGRFGKSQQRPAELSEPQESLLATCVAMHSRLAEANRA